MLTTAALMRRLGHAAVLAGTMMAATGAHAQDMTRVDTAGDWAVLGDSKSPHQFCFATSTPKGSEPAGATRDAPRAYVSAWPKDGVKGEVSFRLGFPIKKDSEGTATVGSASAKLFGSGDRAFVKDPTQELKLLEAMKKGDKLTVQVTSERGTEVTDSYALNGLAHALQKLQDTCF